MAIAPTSGPVGGLVTDAAQPRPNTAPVPEQQAAEQTAKADAPSQAVPQASTDTGVDQEAPRERSVDITV